jgi:hypothetical protein
MRPSNSFTEAEVRLLEQVLDGACQRRKDLSQLTRSRAYASVRAKVQRMRLVIDGAELADAQEGERGQA